MEPPPRRFRAIALILSLTGLAVGLWFAWSRAEPVYRGKPISYWIELDRVNLDSDDEVAAAFAAMDDRAVKWLIAEVAWKPSPTMSWLREKAWKFHIEIPIRKYRRPDAAIGLGRMGPKALAAVPVLQEAVTVAGADGDLNLPIFARAALFRIRNEPIQVLIDELRASTDDSQWVNTVDVLVNLNNEASAAVPFIAGGLDRTNSEYRRSSALMALEVIPSRPENCVPPLVEFIEYAELGLRQRAKSVLRKFGPEAVAAGEAAEARAQRQR
jgi:hypothetical protein